MAIPLLVVAGAALFGTGVAVGAALSDDDEADKKVRKISKCDVPEEIRTAGLGEDIDGQTVKRAIPRSKVPKEFRNL